MNEGEQPANPAVRTAFKGCGLPFLTALSWALLLELIKPIVLLILGTHYVYNVKPYLSTLMNYIYITKKRSCRK